MIVAITGATGFIGSKLAKRHLEAGDEVRVLSRSPENRNLPAHQRLSVQRGDLLDSACDLRDFVAGAKILYNCAGEIRDPMRMQALHVDATARLIDTASGHIKRWVQLSSVGAYGQHRSGVITEKTPVAPIGPYETTKTRADELVEAAALRKAFSATVLRPSNVIGGTMTNQSFFQMISAIHRGIFIFIGPPGACANYIHVDNVVEAIAKCGRASESFAIFNVSQNCSFEDLVTFVCAELRCREPRFRIPEWPAAVLAKLFSRVPGFPLTQARVAALTTRVIYSSEKISKILNYAPSLSIEASIRETAAAWRHRDIAG